MLKDLSEFLIAKIKIIIIKNFKFETGVCLLFRRISRAAESFTPTALTCRLSNWSEWTDCFPCQDKKVRHLWPVWGNLIFESYTRHSNGDKQPVVSIWRSGEKLDLEIGTQKPWTHGWRNLSASLDFVVGHYGVRLQRKCVLWPFGQGHTDPWWPLWVLALCLLMKVIWRG